MRIWIGVLATVALSAAPASGESARRWGPPGVGFTLAVPADMSATFEEDRGYWTLVSPAGVAPDDARVWCMFQEANNSPFPGGDQAAANQRVRDAFADFQPGWRDRAEFSQSPDGVLIGRVTPAQEEESVASGAAFFAFGGASVRMWAVACFSDAVSNLTTPGVMALFSDVRVSR